MIPAHKQTAVEQALQDTFGVNHPDNMQPMTKGLSGSLVYRIMLQDKPYLLRVIPDAASRDNPAHYFGCMQAAADAGLAPAIRYLNIEDRICITDYITAKPFPIEMAVKEMAAVVKKLHGMPSFFTVLPYVAAADSFFERFRLQSILPAETMQLLSERYRLISAVYPRNDRENMVSSHNDLKPDNIIWDGAKPWLVDWEAARLNDRYVDLAAIANFIVKNEADEQELLERYFGAPASDYQRARFFLMSNIVHVFCLAICSLSAAKSELLPDGASRPGFGDFHQLLWDEKIDLGDPEEKLRYGLVHLDAFLHKTGSPRFAESIRIIEAGA